MGLMGGCGWVRSSGVCVISGLSDADLDPSSQLCL